VLVSVGDVRLFVDADGAKLVPEGAAMRERPTVVVVHGGPGFDHTPFKSYYPSLPELAQVVYYDHRGNGRSDRGSPEQWTLDQWADDHEPCAMRSASSGRSSSVLPSAVSSRSTTRSGIPITRPS
jgi:pimeloyl-ACP methyl ester carboxylesterase